MKARSKQKHPKGTCVVIKRWFSDSFFHWDPARGRTQGVKNHGVLTVHLGHDAPLNCSIRPFCNHTWESWVQPDHSEASCQQKTPVCWCCTSDCHARGPIILFFTVKPYGLVSNKYSLMKKFCPKRSNGFVWPISDRWQQQLEGLCDFWPRWSKLWSEGLVGRIFRIKVHLNDF